MSLEHPQDPAARQDISSQLRDRYFSERARLKFIFSNNKSSKVVPFNVTIPIYENPTINESKQARLGKYKPIGRNSNLYSFLGADSTQLNLTFYMTLPHIVSHAKDNSLSKYIEYVNGSVSEESQYSTQGTNNAPQDIPEGVSKILEVIKAYESEYLENTKPPFVTERTELVRERRYRGETTFSRLLAGPLRNELRIIPVENSPKDFISSRDSRTVPNTELITKARILVYFWTNVIRSSVIGSTDHSSPPPIVRFTFGAFYKDVPYIVEKYQITPDEKAGYDELTLLPRRLKITLSMEELRTGNYDNFVPLNFNTKSKNGTLDTMDNVAGWEHIIESGSTHPLFHPKGQ